MSNPASWTLTYNSADQLTSRTDGTNIINYTYDPNGNQATAGTATYAYNLSDQLTSAAQGGTTTTFTYDGDGNRLTSNTSGGATLRYWWDIANPMPMLAQENDASTGNMLRRYENGPQGPLSMTTGGSTYYFARDPLGSITDLTDTSGTADWNWDYEPYGATLTQNKIDPSAPQVTLGYTGQYLDGTSATYNMRAREYDPASSNFQGLDPIAQPLTASFAGVYTYALGNPAVYVDPTGGSSACVSGPCDLGGILINTGSLPPDLGPGPEPCGGPSEQVTLCAPLPAPTGTDTTCGAVGTLATYVEPPGPSGTDQTCSFVYGTMASCAPGPASTGTDSWCGGASDVMGSCEDTFIAALLSGGTQSADESTASNSPTPCPITSVDQIFGDPWILAGKTPAEVEAAIGTLPDWQVETLGQGAHKGQGWVLREYTDGGLITGRMIRWHPGGGRHGDDPYWRVFEPGGRQVAYHP